jgi:hypothetical protein
MTDVKPGFVQGPPDIGGGKRIANLTVTLPAGTPITAADGTISVLSAPAEVFIQKVALSDSQGNLISEFGSSTQDEILIELKRIRIGIGLLIEESLSELDLGDDD